MARCAVRAAFSGATNGQTRPFLRTPHVPPAERGRGHRSAMTLPANGRDPATPGAAMRLLRSQKLRAHAEQKHCDGEHDDCNAEQYRVDAEREHGNAEQHCVDGEQDHGNREQGCVGVSPPRGCAKIIYHHPSQT